MGRGPRRDAARRDLTLVDSSVFVDHLRDDLGPEVAILRSMQSTGLRVAITDLIWLEVMSGLRRGSPQEDALQGFPVIQTRWPADHVAAVELGRQLRDAGRTLSGSVDLLIAAVAIRAGAALLTRDRDFAAIASVSDLRLAT